MRFWVTTSTGSGVRPMTSEEVTQLYDDALQNTVEFLPVNADLCMKLGKLAERWNCEPALYIEGQRVA